VPKQVTPLRQDVVFRRHYLDQTGSQSERHVRLVHRDLRLTRVPMTFRMMPRVTPVIGLSIATKDEEKTIMGPHIRVNRRCLFLLVTAPLLAAQTGDRSSIDGFVTRDMAAVSGATIGIDKKNEGFHLQTTTNKSGYYSIEDLDPGGYSVWAEIKGYGCIIHPHVPLFPGKHAHQTFHFARAKRNPGNCEPIQKTVK